VAHLHQPVPEPAGGDPGHHAPETAPTLAARGPVPGPVPTFGTGVGEVEVLDDQGVRAMLAGGGDELADRRA